MSLLEGVEKILKKDPKKVNAAGEAVMRMSDFVFGEPLDRRSQQLARTLQTSRRAAGTLVRAKLAEAQPTGEHYPLLQELGGQAVSPVAEIGGEEEYLASPEDQPQAA